MLNNFVQFIRGFISRIGLHWNFKIKFLFLFYFISIFSYQNFLLYYLFNIDYPNHSCDIDIQSYSVAYKVFLILHQIGIGCTIIKLFVVPSEHIYVSHFFRENFVIQNDADIVDMHSDIKATEYFLTICSYISFIHGLEVLSKYQLPSCKIETFSYLFIFSYIPFFLKTFTYLIGLFLYLILLIIQCFYYISDEYCHNCYISFFPNHNRNRNRNRNLQNNNPTNQMNLSNITSFVIQINQTSSIEEPTYPKQLYVENNECIICYEESNCNIIPCGHLICNDCDKKLKIENNQKKRCPICRYEYSKLILYNNFVKKSLENNSENYYIATSIIDDILKNI